MHDSISDTTQGIPQLLSVELRVLGALMEKQLTTPDQYPLTLNSLMAACNQKTNRDPVSGYTQGEIARALTQLEHRKLTRKEFGSRAEKFSQQLIKHLELGKKHQAILCVMMLRGPQTLSELNTRTQRMDVFSSKEELEHTLDRLCNRELPLVIRLGQQPGQREERFTHLCSGTPLAANPAVATTEPSPQTSNSSPQNSIDKTASHAELEALRQLLHQLEDETNNLKQQITQLYRLTGHTLPDDSSTGDSAMGKDTDGNG